MRKNLDPNKLLVGVKGDAKKESDIDSIVNKIHNNSAAEKEKQNVPVDRTTLELPKDLKKKIKLRILEKETTLKDYIIELVEKDLGLQ